MSFRFLVFTILTCFGLIGCSTAPTKVEGPAQVETSPIEKRDESYPPGVDLMALQRELGLERANEELGYSEKRFNTCQVSSHDTQESCRTQYFVLIHFQLMCRDTEGTVTEALTHFDIHPISSRQVKWSLTGGGGLVTTDSFGFGQIRTSLPISQRTQRLRLAVGPEFLYTRAGEITRVVAPQPWCNP